MPRPQDKIQLIKESQEEYDALDEFLAKLDPQLMTEPGALGEWSVKDVLAHLYEWQQMFFRWYETGLRGANPVVPAEGYKWSQFPALNQNIYETYQDLPLVEVLQLFRGSHIRTIALVDSLTDEILTTPGLYP